LPLGIAGLSISILAIGILVFFYSSFQQEIRSTNDQLSATNSNISALESSVNDIRSRLVALQNKLLDNEQLDHQVQQDMETQSSELRVLQDKPSLLENQVSALKQEVSRV